MDPIRLLDTTLAIDPQAGTASLLRGDLRLTGLRAEAVIAVEGVERTVDLLGGARAEVDRRGGRGTATLRTDHGAFATAWSLTVDASDPSLEIVVAVSAPGAGVAVREVRTLRLPWAGTPLAGETGRARWWITPSSAWDRPGTRPLAGAVDPDDCASQAHDIASAYAPSGRALTFAHPLPSRWINRIDADGVHGTVTARIGVPVPAAGSLRTDPLLVDGSRAVLDALADAGRRTRGRRAAVEAREHTGWSTWDFFTDKVREQDVHDALAAIAARPGIAGRLRYVVVDDFWQDGCGDWRPGARFGSIERAAQAIAAAGFQPGIWTAPFFADRHSDLLREHPDYALRLDDGRLYAHCLGCDPPWGDRIFLDPTHPGVRDHLQGLYRRLHGWGFRYFKTDFLTDPIAGEFDGERAQWRGRIRFHDPALGLVRGHRACMEAIRAAIGPESFWLGCGTHYASGAGLMDGTRISADMRVHYSSMLCCARSAVFNGHLHGGPFLVDPDFAVFRGRETALPHGLEVAAAGTMPYDRLKPNSGPVFDLAEARLWAAVIAMSGGLVMLSDRLDGLNEQGLAVIGTLLDLCGGEPARPTDLFTPLPRMWIASRGGRPLVLLANWSDASAAVPMAADGSIAAGAELVDAWTGRRLRWEPGAAVELPAHGHLLLRPA